MDNPDELAT